ncbi:MAG: NUDIX domain-containing protein [Streptosporangiales bacterium]|nr:NUDIX domain-containing protein [Streptosporangiales bacterium]MBO0891002.1 NUDIX domain-containing protein [Acidothermales bacterium]
MAGRSAGLLLYKRVGAGLRVLLVHPGGPFWARKDAGAWSIPKGEYADGEQARAAALREFTEETGHAPPDGELLELGTVRQRAGKEVTAWAVEGDFDVTTLESNTFELAWPPRSGRTQTFPEVDRAAWFDEETAREKINAAQTTFLDRLAETLRP